MYKTIKNFSRHQAAVRQKRMKLTAYCSSGSDSWLLGSMCKRKKRTRRTKVSEIQHGRVSEGEELLEDNTIIFILYLYILYIYTYIPFPIIPPVTFKYTQTSGERRTSVQMYGTFWSCRVGLINGEHVLSDCLCSNCV